MICPYCVESVYSTNTSHSDCPHEPGTPFPLLYLDQHSKKDSKDPVVLSVIGFTGHGKTVFLCALFHYLDRYLTTLWPGFFKQALDQDSLTTLNFNRERLEEGTLPDPTAVNFPKPGIFRLRNMPNNGLAEAKFLEDTTVLIYDPAGEAFAEQDTMVKYATFVKRSDCVLFLIDLATLSPVFASRMEKLLGTYVLGMRALDIAPQSQHLIVVYTKSDDTKVSVPQFSNWLAQQRDLDRYLSEQMPATLKDPVEHFRWLEQVSDSLKEFTANELKATSFINMTKEWFASVSYTAVSSLGTAPKTEINEAGKEIKSLSVEMSPRGVVDPLLYVLAKSHKVKPPPKPWWHVFKGPTGIAIGVGLLVVLSVTVLIASFYNAEYRAGSTSMRNKDFKGAINHYTKSIEANPRYAAAYAGRGWAFLELGDADEGISNCNRSLELDPKDPEAITCRGRAKTLKHDYAGALKDCNEAIELMPTYAPAFQCRGYVFWYQRNNDKAIADYTKAIEHDPQLARAYLNRFVAYTENNQRDLAQKDLDKVNEQDSSRASFFESDHVRSYCYRGEISSRGGDQAQAILDYSWALWLDDGATEAYLGRAAANQKLGKLDESEKDYNKVIELNTDSVAAYLARAEVRIQFRRNKEGIDDLTQAINRNPKLDSAYLRRAEVYIAEGQLIEAIADCDTVISREPPELLKRAHLQRGEAALKQAEKEKVKKARDGWFSESSKHFRLAAEEDPGDAEPLIKAAIADMGRDAWEDAAREYDQAVERDESLKGLKNPVISKAFFKMGDRCRYQSEQFEDSRKTEKINCAMENFQKALALNPKNSQAQAWLNFLSAQ